MLLVWIQIYYFEDIIRVNDSNMLLRGSRSSYWFKYFNVRIKVRSLIQIMLRSRSGYLFEYVNVGIEVRFFIGTFWEPLYCQLSVEQNAVLIVPRYSYIQFPVIGSHFKFPLDVKNFLLLKICIKVNEIGFRGSLWLHRYHSSWYCYILSSFSVLKQNLKLEMRWRLVIRFDNEMSLNVNDCILLFYCTWSQVLTCDH